MTFKKNTQKLRNQCQGTKEFPASVLKWLSDENLWNLWVPESHGGLEKSLSDGLSILREIARIDGSLGWTLTLCSGANYFVGNLEPEVANEIFEGSPSPILGGSGGAFGTAEKRGNTYVLNGTWHYATGAPYLTHFTLNAKIIQNGIPLKNEEGHDTIRSFVIPRSAVNPIDDWNTMGLLATATYSFKVNNVVVHQRYSFKYNRFFMPQAIFKIPFKSFADLTLWVNYIGMAEHFLEEATPFTDQKIRAPLQQCLKTAETYLTSATQKIENATKNGNQPSPHEQEALHQTAARTVTEISQALIRVYPFLGIKASRHTHQINQVFRDYFTATQHHIFVER